MTTKKPLWLVFLFSLLWLWACHPKDTNPDRIQFSTWGSAEEMAILKPLLAKFRRQNPDIDLELLHIPDKYFQKLHTLIAANLTPDVVFTNNLNFPIYASNNTFISLETYLKDSQVLKDNDFFKQSLNAFRWKGQLQGIPRDVSNMVFYYNQDLFDKYGVPYPTPDWTYDDFLEITKKLTIDRDKDGKKDIFGVSFDKRYLFWLPYLWSHGGRLFDEAKQTALLDLPAAYNGLQFYSDLRHKYHVAPTSAEAGNASMVEMFMQGKLALQLNGRWAVPGYRENVKFRWDIVTFPHGSGGSIVDADGSGWAIARQSRQPDKAWRLIEFLASQQASQEFSRQGLIIPARQDVAYSDVFLSPQLSPQQARLFLTSLDTARPTPTVPYWNEIVEILNVALEPVWEGKRSAEEAMKEAKKKIDQLL